jgi:hypothetical protein
LLVLSETVKSSSGVVRWNCLCDCGASTTASTPALRGGKKVSCKCYQRERRLTRGITHGQSHSRTYNSWAAVVQRCTNSANHKYKKYGGAGINVCTRWRSFENFLADMGARPQGTTIDRIDNLKGYEPGNCRWADARTQAINRRRTILVDYRGERMCLFDWSKKLDLPYARTVARYRRGLRGDDLFAQAVIKRYSRVTVPLDGYVSGCYGVGTH